MKTHINVHLFTHRLLRIQYKLTRTQIHVYQLKQMHTDSMYRSGTQTPVSTEVALTKNIIFIYSLWEVGWRVHSGEIDLLEG